MEAARRRGGGESPPRSAASGRISRLQGIEKWGFAHFSPGICVFRLENDGFPPQNAPKRVSGTGVPL